MTDYALKLSDGELARYRAMADFAFEQEAVYWAAAGVTAGANVADVGCGPGAVSAVLAGLVGPTGQVLAVDGDASAVDAARFTAAHAGLGNVTVTQGRADDTGIAPGSVDAVMIRHVLAHNGGREQAIVDHAAGLVRPGGCVYVADIDATGIRSHPSDADVGETDELADRYWAWHRRQGNDCSVGLRLSQLLAAAGLEVAGFHGRYDIVTWPPGWRSHAWAGRETLVAAGDATAADVERWAAAFERLDARAERPTSFFPVFVAYGRRPVPAG